MISRYTILNNCRISLVVTNLSFASFNPFSYETQLIWSPKPVKEKQIGKFRKLILYFGYFPCTHCKGQQRALPLDNLGVHQGSFSFSSFFSSFSSFCWSSLVSSGFSFKKYEEIFAELKTYIFTCSKLQLVLANVRKQLYLNLLCS